MAFNLSRMEMVGWESAWRRKLREFLRGKHAEGSRPHGDGPLTATWVPKLNDQDVFNAVLSLSPPTWSAVLPCEWNVQWFAHANSQRLCFSGTTAASPLNCPALLSEGMFHCPRAPAIVHFMAQVGTWLGESYSGDGSRRDVR